MLRSAAFPKLTRSAIQCKIFTETPPPSPIPNRTSGHHKQQLQPLLLLCTTIQPKPLSLSLKIKTHFFLSLKHNETLKNHSFLEKSKLQKLCWWFQVKPSSWNWLGLVKKMNYEPVIAKGLLGVGWWGKGVGIGRIPVRKGSSGEGNKKRQKKN